jgi:cation diffusion facilitator CzcD-associated flavoprotein CzcO
MRERAKQNSPGIDGDYNKVSALDVSAAEREAIFEQRWQKGGLMFSGAFGDLLQNSDSNLHAAEFVRNKIRAMVNDPHVAELLCPENIIGGKRLCVDTNYYATYNEPHVELVSVKDEPIEKMTADGIVAHGREFPVDAIVMVTGFDAMTGALTKVDIRGRNNASLKERWAQGSSSYLGLAMADFPNLLTVTGPGSPSVFTNMLPSIEQHVEWIADCLNYVRENNYSAIEAEHVAENAWWSHCQEVVTKGLKSTTNSWYLGANVAGKARVFMPYFGGFPAYCAKCDEVVANNYDGFSMR